MTLSCDIFCIEVFNERDRGLASSLLQRFALVFFRPHLSPMAAGLVAAALGSQIGNKGVTVEESGAPGGSRTHDLRLRRPTLYPAELRAQ